MKEQAVTKERKPYTVSKQRERWTEEDHQKFVEALKLYGRAWRPVKEHIGTKTAVQIRSHAQKFFSKIERSATAGRGAETGVAQVIDIPPPRRKRKPIHPYPRAAGRGLGKSPEVERPLVVAGSISSSSGVSTAEDTEGCSKSNGSEHDDTAEACHQNVPKGSEDAYATRAWEMPKPANPAKAVSSPVPAAIEAANARPPSMNHSPGPIPAFPTAMPWTWMSGGAMNPAMVNPALMNMMNPALMNPAMMNPALMSPAVMNPAVMNPQGMTMPWGSAPNAQGLENGGAASAMAATFAAASAWWASQGRMPPSVMHPALSAMYLGGLPPLAVPTLSLFPQCAPQGVTVATLPCVDVKEVFTAHVADDGQDIPSCNGSSRSSAMRKVDKTNGVKKRKTQRMGSENHLPSVSSDICTSTSRGSETNLSDEQARTANLTSESTLDSLSKGVLDLNTVKHPLHGFVCKSRDTPADDGPTDDGDDKLKRLRGGARTAGAVMADCERYPSTAGQGRDAPGGVLDVHLRKAWSLSCPSRKFTNIDVEVAYDEPCGSDNSERAGAVQADGNGPREGPSSTSSACGNVAGGNGRSGSSDGSSEGEATCNAERQQEPEKNERSPSHPDNVEDIVIVEKPIARIPKQLTFNVFLPVREDRAKCQEPEGSSWLLRAESVDGEQREARLLFF
ncbi:hypothetical protein M758_2G052100 [Ceratodon purpureus]|nr:hypothetical protein M758_2G052100 [Ceratodon purpureus]